MTGLEPKALLQLYVQRGREALLWKTEGLDEYSVRRPMTPTGTNLLGLVKHVAGVEAGYLGEVFGRPFPEPLPWLDEDAEPNADMWATPEESVEYVTGLYRRVWEHSDATIADVPLEETGTVPWWPEEHRHPTLHRVLVHVATETERHAGHADILRELIDGSVGTRAPGANVPDQGEAWWREYHERLEQAARTAAGRP